MTTSPIVSVACRRLLWLLALSFAVKVLYVFLLTDYQHYLFSDFQGYWDRALERFHGRDSTYAQWAVWPPLPHIFLSWLLHVIEWLGLGHWRLQAVLVANIFLSTLTVALLYDIVLRLTSSSRAALAVAIVYAFALPLLYLNAFVMSEHPAVAALLTALWLLIRFPGRRRYTFVAGIVLAIAVGLRPAFGLIALPCGLYVLLGSPFARVSIVQAAVFSLGFVLTIAGVVAEVHRISHGELTSLAANGGLNFYFAQCRTHQVVSQRGVAVYMIAPPATAALPENGRVELRRPIHDQAFFTALGWQCVRAQPDLWWRNLSKVREMYFGTLLPDVGSAWGFRASLPFFRWLAVAMTVILPLGAIVTQGRRRAVAALFGGIVVASFLTQYAFNAEHRYLYPLFGPILALDAWVVLALYRHWQRYRRAALSYVGAIGVIAAIFLGYTLWQRFASRTLIAGDSYQATRLDTVPGMSTGQFVVDRLRLPNGAPLAARPAVVGLATCIAVEDPGRFEFTVASGDAFELTIDNRLIALHISTGPYAAVQRGADLSIGRHKYLLRYVANDKSGAVAAVWRRNQPGRELMPAVGLRDIGEAGDGVQFLPPGECPSVP